MTTATDHIHMNANHPLPCLRALPVLIVILVAGCNTQPASDPLATMLNRDASYSARRSATVRAAEQVDSADYADALYKVVWDSGYPTWQRIDAVDRLIARDEADFRAALDSRIMSIPELATLNHIFNLAVERQWNDFSPLAVRCYARKLSDIADSDRAERAVLVALNPDKTPEQVILDTFIDGANNESQAMQIAAWELLCRLSDAKQIQTMLAVAPSSELTDDLKAAISELGVLPRNREDVLWIQHLRSDENRDQWRACSQKLSELSDEQIHGMQLRHLALLPLLDDDAMIQSRGSLIAETAVRLGRSEHHYKHRSEADQQSIAANASKLCWADLVTVNMLIDAVRDEDIAAALFEHADADHFDKDTEYGGVIGRDAKTGQFVMRPYKPLLKRRDDVFIPPQIMVNDAYTALFHYHFHVQFHANGEHAGPGDGDMKQVENLQFSHMVITFIDANSLNIDYYQPNGVVIDIDTIKRPRAALSQVGQ